MHIATLLGEMSVCCHTDIENVCVLSHFVGRMYVASLLWRLSVY